MIPGVPYDAEVEYLESTGTQWIDTGTTVSNNSHVIIKMSDFVSAGRWLFGARQGTAQAAFGFFSYNAVDKYVLALGGYTSPSVISYTTVGVGVVTIDINANVLIMTRELTPYTYTETVTGQTFTTPVSLLLFGLNNNGSAISQSSMKLYGAQIDDVRNLVPVRFTNELGQSEGAMYDRVTHRLFRNAGTGSFVIGPDVATPVMSLHFMRNAEKRVMTAKDYIQDGLIAMWDGIENAGWGRT